MIKIFRLLQTDIGRSIRVITSKSRPSIITRTGNVLHPGSASGRSAKRRRQVVYDQHHPLWTWNNTIDGVVIT